MEREVTQDQLEKSDKEDLTETQVHQVIMALQDTKE